MACILGNHFYMINNSLEQLAYCLFSFRLTPFYVPVSIMHLTKVVDIEHVMFCFVQSLILNIGCPFEVLLVKHL